MDATDFVIRFNAELGGVKAANGALSQLEAQIKRESGSIDSLGNSLAAAQGKLAKLMDGGASGKGPVNIAAVEAQRAAIAKLQGQIDGKKSNLAGLVDAKGLASKVDAAKKSAADLETASAQSAAGMSAALHPIDAVTQALGKMGPEGEAAALALQVVAAAVTVVIGTLIAGAAAAIHVSEAAEEMAATLGALAGSTKGGEAAVAMVQKLSGTLPFATSQIGTWARSLMGAGLEGKKLEETIKGVAAAQALMGESGGAAAEGMAKQLAEGGEAAKTAIKGIQDGSKKSAAKLAEMGLQAKDLAAALGMTPEAFKTAKISADQMSDAMNKALQKKGAGALENMVGDLATIVMKAKEGFMSLFKDLSPAVKPFMAALQSLLGMFNKTGSATTALRPIVTAVFSALFSFATRAVDAIRGVVTWLTESGSAGGVFSGVVSVLKAGWSALGAIWDNVKGSLTILWMSLKGIFSDAMVLKGIKTIFTAIAAAVVFVIVAVASFVASIINAVSFVVAGIATVIGAIMSIIGEVTSVGQAIADGLTNGLDPGAFIAKMGDMASAGLAAFKDMLGIASPSKVMMEMGRHTADGFSQGVDDGSEGAQASMAAMVDPAAAAGKGGGGGKGKGKSVTIGTLNIYPRDFDDFREQFDRRLEELAGGAMTPETT